MSKTGYVYIMSSHSRRLYTGVISDLEGRGWDHKQGVLEGFTKTYKINQLVFYEDYPDMLQAIAREKQLKVGREPRRYGLFSNKIPGGKIVGYSSGSRSFDCGSATTWVKKVELSPPLRMTDV